MIKYKATSALNYLSENSYKGDGAPGMVMGIASDARGDTNTYEDTKKLDEVAFLAPAIWSAARVATPWLLKQGWKIIKGSGKFAWKNPKTAVVVGGGVAYKDELAAVAEYLSGIGEAIEPVLKYAKQYALPVMAVFALMYGGKKIHDMLTDNDPEAEPDEETPILGRGEDGELADIRKLSGLTEAFAWDKLEENILSDRKIWVSDSLEKDAKEKLKTVSKEDIAMAKAIDPEISGSPFPDMSILDIINKRVMLITKKWNDSLLSKNYPMGTTKEDIEQAVYNQIGNYLESGILDEIEDGYSDINAYRGPAYVEWKQSLGPNADELIKQAVSMSTNRHTNWHVGSNLDTDALYTKDEYELIDPKLGSGKAEKFGMWADDELNEIKKLSGLEEVKRKKRPDLDDLDDEEDEEKAEDPDADKVQHILMQLRKAQDVDGDHPIKFLDGTKVKLPLEDITLFMNKYMDMKPLDREKMQQVAIISKEQFDKILTFFQPKHGQRQKSIYEK